MIDLIRKEMDSLKQWITYNFVEEKDSIESVEYELSGINVICKFILIAMVGSWLINIVLLTIILIKVF